jgi:hypothetical protein
LPEQRFCFYTIKQISFDILQKSTWSQSNDLGP